METGAAAGKVHLIAACAVALALLLLLAGTSMADDMGDFDVVKNATCSDDSADDLGFWMGMTGLLGKLVGETPKHKDKDGGFSYTGNTEFGPKGEATATCVKGKDDVKCGACVGVAVGRVTKECSGKASGSVELKICQVSFNKK